MNIEDFREFCLSKNFVTEDFPFDNVTLAFKVDGKLFALTNVDLFETVNLKCDPEYAIELREQYQDVTPGFHMNKKHWNTVKVNGDVDDTLFFKLVEHSYNCVVKGFSRRRKKELGLT